MPSNLFDDVDPIIDTIGLGQSWISMQEWADVSLQPMQLEEQAAQAVEEETRATGGVRFCCYGAASSEAVSNRNFTSACS